MCERTFQLITPGGKITKYIISLTILICYISLVSYIIISYNQTTLTLHTEQSILQNNILCLFYISTL